MAVSATRGILTACDVSSIELINSAPRFDVMIRCGPVPTLDLQDIVIVDFSARHPPKNNTSVLCFCSIVLSAG